LKVAIRADASIQIGTGHVMRCLTLAEELRRRGSEVLFICRRHAGNLCGLISEKGFRVECLPGQNEALDETPAGPASRAHRVEGENLPAHAEWLGADWRLDAEQTAEAIRGLGVVDWLIVDHYALDARWESAMRAAAHRIMVIDDLADRAHDCDLLLDQNYYKIMADRYEELVPMSCRQLLGPRYALLRQEFIASRSCLRKRDGKVRHLLVFFGGVDRQNMTRVALDALALIDIPEIYIDVVVGSTNPHLASLEERFAGDPHLVLHVQVEDMARFMASADLAIGGVGSTAWERCYLELPSLVVSMAANQTPAAEDLAALGAVRYLGSSHDIDAARLAHALEECMDAPRMLREMIKKCRDLMGLNVSTRLGTDSVCSALIEQAA
jgi:UDP-2,4-diacetamido-2,4,6-trideoxy-beta-L-altropyranose hydrolase